MYKFFELLELDEYLELEFIKRSGCGIGLTRLIKSMEKEGIEIINTTNPNHETYLVENLRNGYSKKIRSNSTQSNFEPDLKGDESKEIFQDDKSYKFVLYHKKVKIYLLSHHFENNLQSQPYFLFFYIFFLIIFY